MQSINQCKSLPCRQAGVIQMSYDIVKAHGSEIKVETREAEGLSSEALSADKAGSAEAGSEFIIVLSA